MLKEQEEKKQMFYTVTAIDWVKIYDDNYNHGQHLCDLKVYTIEDCLCRLTIKYKLVGWLLMVREVEKTIFMLLVVPM